MSGEFTDLFADAEDGPPLSGMGIETPALHRRQPAPVLTEIAVAPGPYNLPPPQQPVHDDADEDKYARRPSRFRQFMWSVELWRHGMRRKTRPCLERCWRQRQGLRRCMCCLIGMFVLFLFSVGQMSDPAAYIPVHPLQLSWAHTGQPGVDFTAVSLQLTCEELRLDMLANVLSPAEQPSLAVLREAAERALRASGSGGDNGLACVCAPMFGTRRRIMTIAAGTDAAKLPQHMYNPIVDATWDGRLPSGEVVPAASTKSIVPEKQQHMFPDKTEAVEHVRRDAIRLSFVNEKCSRGAVILQKEAAWCAQACIDLMNGKTIYQ